MCAKKYEYEIHIGEVFDMETNSKKPKQKMIITKEQFYIIEAFANRKIDADLNTIYKLNDCEFRVFPHFDFNSNNENCITKKIKNI